MKITRKHWLLILLSMFLIIANIIWLSLETRPPSWDASVHLNLTFKYWQIIRHFSFDSFKKIIAVTGYYPPVFHLSVLTLFAFKDVSLFSATLTNLVYLVILIWATYSIGKILYNELVGILSAVLVSMYPFLIYMSRSFVIDLAITSFVTLGFYLYLKSDNFSKCVPSIFFGLVSGLGMLVKWTYAFFLLGPALYSFWNIFMKLHSDDIGTVSKRNTFLPSRIAYSAVVPISSGRRPGISKLKFRSSLRRSINIFTNIKRRGGGHSTVTDLAKFRGWSTSQPRFTAI